MKLTILFLLGLCTSGFGQDYLLTNKGDTLRGKIKPQFQERLDRVKIKIEKKTTSYTAQQIREMSYNSAIYRPVPFMDNIRFMKLEKEGYLKLYSFRIDNQLTFGGRYLQKSDGTGSEVPNLMFKKKMVEFLRDDTKLADKIEAGTYGRSDLDKIIDEYNANISKNTHIKKAEGEIAFQASQKLDLLLSLKKNVESQPDFTGKKDAIDLITDMESKIKKSESLPGYMIEGLKTSLASTPAVQADLEKFLAAN